MRGIACVALVLLASIAPAFATHLGPEDVNARHAIVVVRPQASLEWPVVSFDGTLELRGVPEGEGGGPQQETANAVSRLYGQRLGEGANVTLSIDVDVNDSEWRLHAWATAENASQRRLMASFVALEPGRRTWTELGVGFIEEWNSTSYERNHTLTAPSGSRGLLLTATGLPFPQVDQVALWIVGQEGPTVQRSRAVLVAVSVAPGCGECDIVESVVREFAAAVDPVPEGEVTYARPWRTAPLLTAVAAFLAVLALWFGPARGRRRDD